MARIRRDVKSDRLERIAVNSGATLRDPSGQPDDVVVCDLSGTGFRLSGERTLSSDGDVTLGIGGIVRTARIVRETDTGYGFAFAQRKIYDRAAAERHWERLIALYRRRLG